MKKGFTLIELLAVIVILAVIGLITIPIIGNIIEDSKKKAFETSINGLIEAANYFTISNDGVYEFLFDENKKGETEEGSYVLDYNGKVDAEGSLYVDNDGNISLCLMNNNYYVYKNYNSGIYIGNISEDTCIIGYDALTNKYVAMLDDGTGQVSNVYSKDDVDSFVTNLQEQITSNDTDIETLSNLISDNTANLVSLQAEVDKLNNTLEYVFQSYNATSDVDVKMNVYRNGLLHIYGTFTVTEQVWSSVLMYTSTSNVYDIKTPCPTSLWNVSTGLFEQKITIDSVSGTIRIVSYNLPVGTYSINQFVM